MSQISYIIKQDVYTLLRTKNGKSLLFTPVIVWVFIGVMQRLMFSDVSSDGIISDGGIIIMSMMLALIMPGSYVAKSIAGERELKTMESLLVLPIPRRRILIGKICAGMILVLLISVSNSISVFGLYPIIMTLISDSTIIEYTVTIGRLLTLLFIMILTGFIGLGLGISIASTAETKESSNGRYMFLVVLPGIMLLQFDFLLKSVPESITGKLSTDHLWFLVPWIHLSAIFNKLSFPSWYRGHWLSGSMMNDLLFHITCILLIQVIVIYIAAKIFGSDDLLN